MDAVTTQELFSSRAQYAVNAEQISRLADLQSGIQTNIHTNLKPRSLLAEAYSNVAQRDLAHNPSHRSVGALLSNCSAKANEIRGRAIAIYHNNLPESPIDRAFSTEETPLLTPQARSRYVADWTLMLKDSMTDFDEQELMGPLRGCVFTGLEEVRTQLRQGLTGFSTTHERIHNAIVTQFTGISPQQLTVSALLSCIDPILTACFEETRWEEADKHAVLRQYCLADSEMQSIQSHLTQAKQDCDDLETQMLNQEDRQLEELVLRRAKQGTLSTEIERLEKVPKTPWIACERGDTDAFEALKKALDSLLSPKKKAKFLNSTDTDKTKNSMLHIACTHQHPDIVEWLLEKNADCRLRDKTRNQPLHIAAKIGNVRIVELLIQKQAPLNVHGAFGHTPLHAAAVSGHHKIVQVLLDAGADVNIISKDGLKMTALHYAAAAAHNTVIMEICKNVPSGSQRVTLTPHQQDSKGRTPFAYALESERFSTCIHIMSHSGWRKEGEYTSLHQVGSSEKVSAFIRSIQPPQPTSSRSNGLGATVA